MEIKVTDTRLQKIKAVVYDIEKDDMPTTVDKLVHVTDVILVLVHNISTERNKSIIFHTGCWSYPILISESQSEKIEKGDWYYSRIHKQLFQCIDEKQYFDENESKVVALLEHFSPKDIKDVASGILVEGRYMVECRNGEWVCYPNCTEDERCDQYQEQWVNLNESNHITIQKHKPDESKVLWDVIMKYRIFAGIGTRPTEDDTRVWFNETFIDK